MTIVVYRCFLQKLHRLWSKLTTECRCDIILSAVVKMGMWFTVGRWPGVRESVPLALGAEGRKESIGPGKIMLKHM